jgi:hypothetical protein
MFERFMMPFDRHFDDGLGATGQAFKDAADRLAVEHEGGSTFINGHLPISFLYRHSVELFLKSVLIVIHRALTLTIAGGLHEKDPKVLVDGKWKLLHQVHSVGQLYASFKTMVQDNSTKIGLVASTDWSQFPVELDGWISAIESADAGSTYFRYPKTKSSSADAKKSGFQVVELASMVNSPLSKESSRGRLFLALKDDDNAIVEAFEFQENPLPDVRYALEQAAAMLSGVSLGIYTEFVDGSVRQT